MSSTGRMPAEALAPWLRQVADLVELGQPLNVSTDGALVLDLTRDIADKVARPAGPLTMFVLGLALGSGHEDGEELGPRLADLAEQVRDLADREGAQAVAAQWRSS